MSNTAPSFSRCHSCTGSHSCTGTGSSWRPGPSLPQAKTWCQWRSLPKRSCRRKSWHSSLGCQWKGFCQWKDSWKMWESWNIIRKLEGCTKIVKLFILETGIGTGRTLTAGRTGAAAGALAAPGRGSNATLWSRAGWHSKPEMLQGITNFHQSEDWSHGQHPKACPYKKKTDMYSSKDQRTFGVPLLGDTNNMQPLQLLHSLLTIPTVPKDQKDGTVVWRHCQLLLVLRPHNLDLMAFVYPQRFQSPTDLLRKPQWEAQELLKFYLTKSLDNTQNNKENIKRHHYKKSSLVSYLWQQ